MIFADTLSINSAKLAKTSIGHIVSVQKLKMCYAASMYIPIVIPEHYLIINMGIAFVAMQ